MPRAAAQGRRGGGAHGSTVRAWRWGVGARKNVLAPRLRALSGEETDAGATASGGAARPVYGRLAGDRARARLRTRRRGRRAYRAGRRATVSPQQQLRGRRGRRRGTRAAVGRVMETLADCCRWTCPNVRRGAAWRDRRRGAVLAAWRNVEVPMGRTAPRRPARQGWSRVRCLCESSWARTQGPSAGRLCASLTRLCLPVQQQLVLVVEEAHLVSIASRRFRGSPRHALAEPGASRGRR